MKPSENPSFLSDVLGTRSLLTIRGFLSNGMDQQEASEEHHRAGHAMNGKRCGLSSARHQNVGHVAKRDDGENQKNYAYRPDVRSQHQCQNGRSRCDVPDSFPVLYAHFGSRDGILAAVAIEGFQELGLALEKARKRVQRENMVSDVGMHECQHRVPAA